MNLKCLKKQLVGLWVCFFCLGFVSAATDGPPTVTRIQFNQETRKLWEDHINYSRLYIINTLAGLPAKGATSARLLENQGEIANLLGSYYGEEATHKLAALLTDHILIAAEVIDAAKKGEVGKQEATTSRWYANSDAIAVYLEELNPKNWPADDMRKMLREHLGTTKAEITAGLNKDWNGEIAAYDKLEDQILEMADRLSIGIVKQFPSKFNK